MGEVNLTINGRSFGVSCDDGQEQRVVDLGHYVDSRLKEIAGAGAAGNEMHLLLLTSLMLADEVFDLRENLNTGKPVNGGAISKQDEAMIAEAINHFAGRIDTVADRLQENM